MIALLLGLLGCADPPPECVSTAQCGDGQACIVESCVDVECLASAECAIGSWCSPDSYTCEPGCASSEDCLAGERCDVSVNQCVPRGCRDTQLDCDFGERCDLEAGVCRDDPQPHCEVCQDDFDCGPGGSCLALSGDRRPRCIMACSPEAFDPCPAGMQCTARVDREGTLVGYICIGVCDMM
mgnify:CR=1 FL=1